MAGKKTILFFYNQNPLRYDTLDFMKIRNFSAQKTENAFFFSTSKGEAVREIELIKLFCEGVKGGIFLSMQVGGRNIWVVFVTKCIL